MRSLYKTLQNFSIDAGEDKIHRPVPQQTDVPIFWYHQHDDVLVIKIYCSATSSIRPHRMYAGFMRTLCKTLQNFSVEGEGKIHRP